MSSPLNLHNAPFRAPTSALGAASAAWSGSAIPLVNTLLAATEDPDDPYGLLDEDDSAHADSHCIVIPDGVTHAYVWMAAICTTAFTLTTSAVLNLFGRVPFPQNTKPGSGSTGLGKFELSRFNSALPNLLSYPSNDHHDAGIYVPVTENAYTRGTPGVTLDRIALRHQYSGSLDLVMTEPRLIVVSGLDRLIATVATAAVLSDEDPAAGAIALCRLVIQ